MNKYIHIMEVSQTRTSVNKYLLVVHDGPGNGEQVPLRHDRAMDEVSDKMPSYATLLGLLPASWGGS